MTPTFVRRYTDGNTDGELRIGWASWDHGSYRCRSFKWAYLDKSGKISRGCPEIPPDIAADMVILGIAQGEYSAAQLDIIRAAVCPENVSIRSAPVLINNDMPAQQPRHP